MKLVQLGLGLLWIVAFLVKRVNPSPEDFLDAEIEARLGALPDLVEGAVKSQQATLRYQKQIRQSFGWASVVGSWMDVFSDLVVNNRTFTAVGGVITIHRYGFILLYGIGFGFPYLLGIQSPSLSCSSRDYLDVLGLFGLNKGLQIHFR